MQQYLIIVHFHIIQSIVMNIMRDCVPRLTFMGSKKDYRGLMSTQNWLQIGQCRGRTGTVGRYEVYAEDSPSEKKVHQDHIKVHPRPELKEKHCCMRMTATSMTFLKSSKCINYIESSLNVF